jgi:transketolase
MSLSAQELQKLEETSNSIRINIIKMLEEAGSGHSAGPLGMADVFTALYFKVLNIDPLKPEMEDRDRFVLSCGHICPVLYATMAERGFFPVSELQTLRKLGSPLQGHPHREALPGLETTSGPLGSGLSQASGMAMVAKMDRKDWKVYCVMSDGEHDEGNTWEAIEFAAKYKLNNLIGIVDRNNIQIDGMTDHIMPLGDLGKKYLEFGWNVIDIDGNNFEEIVEALEKGKFSLEKPTVIIAHTIPGKGVDFMENNFEWHGKSPGDEEAKKALAELRTLGGKIRSEHQ